jgi:hypothetical protein
MENEGLTWERIYSSWKGVCREVYPQLLTQDIFKIIRPSTDCKKYGTYRVIDLWDNENIQRNINIINRDDGFPHYLLNNYIGIRDTSQMLWECRDNKENIAIILIYSFMREFDNWKKQEWNKKSLALIDKVFKIVSEEITNKEIPCYWSSGTKYVLPDAIDKDIYKSPSNIHDLLYIICLDVLVIMTSYTLVYVSNETNESKSE